MGIKDYGITKSLSLTKVKANEKICSNNTKYIVFSFKHLTGAKKYRAVLNDEQVLKDFFGKLSLISKLTWENFHSTNRKSGYELMTWGTIDQTIRNSSTLNLSDDEKIYVVRFNSQRGRIFLKRGTQCSRIANVLAIDTDLSAYKH